MLRSGRNKQAETASVRYAAACIFKIANASSNGNGKYVRSPGARKCEKGEAAQESAADRMIRAHNQRFLIRNETMGRHHHSPEVVSIQNKAVIKEDNKKKAVLNLFLKNNLYFLFLRMASAFRLSSR